MVQESAEKAALAAFVTVSAQLWKQKLLNI